MKYTVYNEWEMRKKGHTHTRINKWDIWWWVRINFRGSPLSKQFVLLPTRFAISDRSKCHLRSTRSCKYASFPVISVCGRWRESLLLIGSGECAWLLSFKTNSAEGWKLKSHQKRHKKDNKASQSGQNGLFMSKCQWSLWCWNNSLWRLWNCIYQSVYHLYT